MFGAQWSCPFNREGKPHESYPEQGIVYPIFFSSHPSYHQYVEGMSDLYQRPPYATQPVSFHLKEETTQTETDWKVIDLASEYLPVVVDREPAEEKEAPIPVLVPQPIVFESSGKRTFLQLVLQWKQAQSEIQATKKPCLNLIPLIEEVRRHKLSFRDEIVKAPWLGEQIAAHMQEVLSAYECAFRIEIINLILQLDIDPTHLEDRLRALCLHFEKLKRQNLKRAINSTQIPFEKYFNTSGLNKNLLGRLLRVLRLGYPECLGAFGRSTRLTCRFFANPIDVLKEYLQERGDDLKRGQEQYIFQMLDHFSSQGKIELVVKFLNEDLINSYYSYLRNKKLSGFIP